MGDTHNIGDHVSLRGMTYTISDEYPNPNTGALYLVPIVRMCTSCGENQAGDYETGDASLCGSCVNRALEFRAAIWVMENIGEYDIPLARTLAALDEDDARMRSSHMPYVDSQSSAMDYVRGMDMNERIRVFNSWGHFISDALGDPGDSQGRTSH